MLVSVILLAVGLFCFGSLIVKSACGSGIGLLVFLIVPVLVIIVFRDRYRVTVVAAQRGEAR